MMPAAPRITNDSLHDQRPSIQARRGKASAAPNREPENSTPLARPRSPGGSQFTIARALPGNAPASATPNRKRIDTREARFHAAPVSAVSALHAPTTVASATFGPARSANHPEGICARAYPNAKALKTRPIALSESDIEPATNSFADEMQTRST